MVRLSASLRAPLLKEWGTLKLVLQVFGSVRPVFFPLDAFRRWLANSCVATICSPTHEDTTFCTSRAGGMRATKTATTAIAKMARRRVYALPIARDLHSPGSGGRSCVAQERGEQPKVGLHPTPPQHLDDAELCAELPGSRSAHRCNCKDVLPWYFRCYGLCRSRQGNEHLVEELNRAFAHVGQTEQAIAQQIRQVGKMIKIARPFDMEVSVSNGGFQTPLCAAPIVPRSAVECAVQGRGRRASYHDASTWA